MLKSMVLVVNPGGDPPLFSYQAILRSKDEAERTSVSPSPSTSAAKTDRAPLASVAITRAVNWGDVAPSLSYQAIVSPRNEAERTSMSPSPSTSAAKTEYAPSAEPVITVWPGNAALRWMVLFSYQAILSSTCDADRTSVSPSPSRSAANTQEAAMAAVEMVRAVHVGGEAPLFSYQAILLSPCDADRTSVSPSPSTSAAKTDKEPEA